MEQRPNRPVMIPTESTSNTIRPSVRGQFPMASNRSKAGGQVKPVPHGWKAPPAMVFRSLPAVTVPEIAGTVGSMVKSKVATLPVS